MTLWFRLIWVLLTARRRAKISSHPLVSSLTLRVLPNDIDFSLHMTNARYLSIMDLGRIDIAIRMGLWRAAVERRWMPVASAAVLRFRRELRPFQRYRLETRIVAWADTTSVMEQVFLFDGGPKDGQVAARALIKGGFYDRRAKSFVTVYAMMDAIGVRGASPEVPPDVAAFLAADQALRARDGQTPRV